MRKTLLFSIAMSVASMACGQAIEKEFSYYDPTAPVTYYNTNGTTMMRIITGIRIEGRAFDNTTVAGVKIKDWPFKLGMTDYYLWAGALRPSWNDASYDFKGFDVVRNLPDMAGGAVSDLEAYFEQPVSVPVGGLYVGISFRLRSQPLPEEKACIPIIANTDKESHPGGIPDSFYLGLASGYLGDYSNRGALTMTLLLKDESGVREVAVDGGVVEYYDLHGRRVEKPQNGIFIKKQGGKTVKAAM